MLKISYSGCFCLYPAISAQFTFKMRVAAQNRRNSLKLPIVRVQGHLRSSMLTFLRSSLPLLVVISNMSVPICNHFYVRRANIGRITFFGGCSSFAPSFFGTLFTSGMEFCHEILETLRYHRVKPRSL